MKKNYTLKTIRTSLAVFAMALSFNFASAQTDVDGTTNLRTIGNTTYDPGAITIVSTADIALTEANGATFKLQATVTPTSTANGTSAFIQSSASGNRWGVDNALIDGNNGESVMVTDITIIDFNANGSGYTESAISNLHFEGITFRGAQGTADNPRVTVDGANAGTFDLGVIPQNGLVPFGIEYTNASDPTATYTVGGTDDVTNVTLTTATTTFQNAFQVISFVAGYTFTTDPTLSVEDFQKDALSIYPTIVSNSFSVNKDFKSLQLIDLTGKTVKTFSASDALEVSGLVSGLYIVKIQSDSEGIATGRLIVK
ncbi:T9SS type A sorting domain-containing protein [Polaribacter sp.]|nr:T9SS type A sorting domain-containing protein [Polaribacter sp.]